MTKTQKTSLPKYTPISKIIAKLVHLSMYLTLAGIAGSGLLIGLSFSMGVKQGLLIEIIVSIHEFFVSIVYWLISIHVSSNISSAT